mgnify:CR=1 FL=1
MTKEQAVQVVRVDATTTFKVKKPWSRRFSNMTRSNSHISGFQFYKSKEVGIILPLVDPATSQSKLVILSGSDGRTLAEVDFKGKTHFSMPLAVDDFIILPTTKGLHIYQVR